jgi:hypothetical protein
LCNSCAPDRCASLTIHASSLGLVDGAIHVTCPIANEIQFMWTPQVHVERAIHVVLREQSPNFVQFMVSS